MTATLPTHGASVGESNHSGAPVPIRLYLVVLLVALFVRAGIGTFHSYRLDDPTALEFPDEQQYWATAQSLAAGNGLRDELEFRATRMPLYPAALSVFARFPRGVIGVRVAQWFIGSVAAVCTAGIAVTLLGRRAGWTAGLLVAADPFLAFFSSLLLTETLFIAGLTALWWSVASLLVNAAMAKKLSCWVAVGFLYAHQLIELRSVFKRRSCRRVRNTERQVPRIKRLMRAFYILGEQMIAGLAHPLFAGWEVAALRNRSQPHKQSVPFPLVAGYRVIVALQHCCPKVLSFNPVAQLGKAPADRAIESPRGHV